MGRPRTPRGHGSGPTRFVHDPITGQMAELRRVQPFQAIKTYLCPACNQEIPPGTGHVVVVPLAEPDARRHWHASCWDRRAQRFSR